MAKIDLICVGKAKPGSPEQALYQKYADRCRFDIQLIELAESKAAKPAQAMAKEAKAIAAKLHASAFCICLDERGKDLTSPELAATLETAFLDQRRPTFIIGGSHGLDASLRQRADLSLRFGRVVWPHLLIRGMLAEQIYRSQTILDHHPYHRI